MDKKNKKTGKFIPNLSWNFWIVFSSICVFFIIFVAAGFIVYKLGNTEVVERSADGGYVTLNYVTDADALTLVNANPTVDATGMKNNSYFAFSVDVDLKEASKIEYEISLKKDEELSSISDDDIKIYLEKENNGVFMKSFGPEKFTPLDKTSDVGTSRGNMVLANVKKIKSGTDNYRLRIWLSDNSTSMNKSYSVEVEIKAVAK